MNNHCTKNNEGIISFSVRYNEIVFSFFLYS